MRITILTISKHIVQWQYVHLYCAVITPIQLQDFFIPKLTSSPAPLICFLSLNFTIPGTACKWNYTIFALGGLAPFP